MTSDNNVLIDLKKEIDEESLDTIEIDVNGINSFEYIEHGDFDEIQKPNIHEINAFSSDTRQKKRRGRQKKSNSREPVKRSFRYCWLQIPGVKDWVVPVPNNLSYVSCKLCKVFLRAHLHDLRKHSLSKKHRKRSLLSENTDESSDIPVNCPDSMESISVIKVPTTFGEKDGSPKKESMLYPAHIGFIGCGNMAQALISGFITNELIDPLKVLVSAPTTRNLLKVKPLGIQTTHDNRSVIEQSDLVFLAVKPHIIPEVLGRVDALSNSSHNPLFVSIATGLSIERLEAMLSHVVSRPRLIRVMPNTPSMVLQGCSVYSLGTNADESDGKVLKCLMGSVGVCERVPETQIDAACGVAGSGPAYIYAAIEALSDGAVKMGLPRHLATTLAAQTVKGAATMVLETGRHPGKLKDEVCSPGGTTITAMHVLEKHGFRNALISAVEASASRSKELG